MKKISIIIPIYNEEKNIVELLDKIQKIIAILTYDFEIICINDGSTDNTLSILKNFIGLNELENFKIINFSRNFGQQNAIKAGYDYSTGDACICLDADLQNPPETIIEMINFWEKGYKIVQCKREGGKQKSGIIKDLTSNLFYFIVNKLSDIEIERNVPDFRLLDRNVLEVVKSVSDSEKELFLRGIIGWIGFKKKTIYYYHNKRVKGKSGYSLYKMLKFATIGITGFSTKPLLLAIFIGAFLFLCSIVYSIYVVYLFYSHNTISGWASTIISIFTLGGIQLMFMGVMGIYIARIHTQVKNRPHYIVESIL